ncbi:hypothetical protein [Candidatus Bathycorpusculum sp.]|uniref:hypothetical protein n=1 Tax=Candidatus Bathycorpusculum sp. TaxID=2994959 RepID=UPI0028358DC5|nr:hypothetical protein [Candidatus Termitimicrobium sp.]MCL2431698.1 hypothetical protein [Candidatus Termitimicrobium sp.]
MNKTKTKFLAGLIVFVLFIGIIPLTVQCQSESEPTPTVTAEPEPTDKPTETPKPTDKPSETPKPTDKPSETPKPTDNSQPTSASTRRPTPTPKSSQADSLFLIEIAVGVLVLCVVAFLGFMFIRKRGPNEKKLRKLSSSEFNTWVLKRLAGKPASSMDASFGIDGFTSLGYPLSIKQSDNVGMNSIDLFAASVARSKARNGVIVAFGFSDDAIRGKVRARRGGLDIQMLTVQELLDTKRFNV